MDRPDILKQFLRKAKSEGYDLLNEDGTYSKVSGEVLKRLAEKISGDLSKKIKSFSDQDQSRISFTPRVDKKIWIHEVNIRRFIGAGDKSTSESKVQLILIWLDGSVPINTKLSQEHEQVEKWFEYYKKIKKDDKKEILQIDEIPIWEVYFIRRREDKKYLFFKSYAQIKNKKELVYKSVSDKLLNGVYTIEPDQKVVHFVVKDKNVRYFSFTGHLNDITKSGQNIINGLGTVRLDDKLYGTPIVLKPCKDESISEVTLDTEVERIELGKDEGNDKIISYLNLNKRVVFEPLRPNSLSSLDKKVKERFGAKVYDYDALRIIFKEKEWTSFSRVLSSDKMVSVGRLKFTENPIDKRIDVSYHRQGHMPFSGYVVRYDERFLSINFRQISGSNTRLKVFAKNHRSIKGLRALKSLTTLLKVNRESYSELVTVREVMVSKKIQIKEDDQGRASYADFLELSDDEFPDELKPYLTDNDKGMLSYMEFGRKKRLHEQYMTSRELSGDYSMSVNGKKEQSKIKLTIHKDGRLEFCFEERVYTGFAQTSNSVTWATLYYEEQNENPEHPPVQVQFSESENIDNFKGHLTFTKITGKKRNVEAIPFTLTKNIS